MKKLMLWIVALAAMPGGALFAQDITGTWQGTLQGPRELRTVVKISRTEGPRGGGLQAVLYSIDQGGQGLPGTVTLQAPTVKISLPGIGGTYEGKLEADANTITGTWSQGGPTTPLVLKRATPETAWAIPEPPAPPKPMAADADPEFEVATIKPSKPDTPGKAFQVRGREFSTLNTTLNDLITFAYGIHPRQIVGGPSWMETEKFDLLAKPDGEGQPNDRQWKIMLQKLLKERFELTFHRDKRELSVYRIVVDTDGPKLTRSTGDPNGLPGLFFRGLGVLPARNATMGDFAGVMQGAVLDRPVVDQTGLSGRFDFMLTWKPDEFQFAALRGAAPQRGAAPGAPPQAGNAPADDRPDLFTAFREQLGLRLESTRLPADVLVIDSAERASPN